MLEIKSPDITDAPAISCLLESLGYPNTQSFIEKRITQLLTHNDAILLIAVDKEQIHGVISLHFIPQIALVGDFCRISYFCVSERSRRGGIGAILEKEAVNIAKQRGCDRIEVHCNAKRTDAHRFYYGRGYTDSPKYLCKSLIE